MKLKYDKRRLIIKGKEGKDYPECYDAFEANVVIRQMIAVAAPCGMEHV